MSVRCLCVCVCLLLIPDHNEIRFSQEGGESLYGEMAKLKSKVCLFDVGSLDSEGYKYLHKWGWVVRERQ